MHYSKFIMERGAEAIENVILSMPTTFTSFHFLGSFVSRFPHLHEGFVRHYMGGRDVPHARQIANIQLMHTVRNKFGHLVEKTGDTPNPNGGDMSTWCRR
jgi:hypothetical protein